MSSRLVFDHTAGVGKITSGDFIHAPVALYDVADGDIAQRMAEGWAVDEWFLPRRMYQARQVRLRVPDDVAVTMPTGVTWSLEQPDVAELSDIYEKYRSKKQFSDHMPIAKTIELVDRDNKQVIVFRVDGEAVAFTLVRMHPRVMSSLQFCWDYANPKLRLGFVSQDVEFAVAKQHGCDYVYIGPGYETVCAYKSRLPGFEWWTGSEWSTDRKLYMKLLERDSRLQTIQDIMGPQDAATA